MKKRNKIIYWIATIWLSLGLVSTGVVQLLQIEEEVAFVLALGYPSYLLPFLGLTKILAVAALLLPRLPRLKEWAYAGILFTMAGAVYSHIAADRLADLFPPLLMTTLTLLSWSFRSPEKKYAVQPA